MKSFNPSCSFKDSQTLTSGRNISSRFDFSMPKGLDQSCERKIVNLYNQNHKNDRFSSKDNIRRNGTQTSNNYYHSNGRFSTTYKSNLPNKSNSQHNQSNHTYASQQNNIRSLSTHNLSGKKRNKKRRQNFKERKTMEKNSELDERNESVKLMRLDMKLKKISKSLKVKK